MYIGQSVNVKDRIHHHKSSLRHNRHDSSYLQNSWNKYGEENFEFVVLEYCDEDKLDELERKYIQEYNAMDRNCGYNRESGGSLNKHMSEDLRRQMSERMKGKYVGEKNYWYGKHRVITEEQRRNLSIRFSGEGNPMYGVHLKKTEEQRKAESIRFSGAGNPFYGKKHTPETRSKISASRKKTPVRCVETGAEYESGCEAMRQTGIHNGSILRACKKHLTAGGYHWEFVV